MKSLKDKLEDLAKEFYASEDRLDKLTCAALYAILGAYSSNGADLLIRFGKELAQAGIERCKDLQRLQNN